LSSVISICKVETGFARLSIIRDSNISPAISGLHQPCLFMTCLPASLSECHVLHTGHSRLGQPHLFMTCVSCPTYWTLWFGSTSSTKHEAEAKTAAEIKHIIQISNKNTTFVSQGQTKPCTTKLEPN